MEWENTPESSNIEDRRGQGGGGGIPISGGTGGLGIGVIIIVFAISYFTGINPSVLLGGAQILTGNGNGASTSSSAPAPRAAQSTGGADDRTTSLVRHVLGE